MELTFIQEMSLEEIKLRGRVMTMATDLEMLLLRIFLYCLIQTPDEVLYFFKKMVLETKISKAKKFLKEVHPDKYEEYKSTFKDLKAIGKFRNKFAHCTILWDKKGKDKSYFNLVIIAEIDGKESFRIIKMTFYEFNEKVKKMLSVIMSLANLSKSIEDEFNYKYPDFFNSSMA